MFKFLKEIKNSIKEGIEEAKVEMAEDALVEAEAEIASHPVAGADERFGTALGAPYRAIYATRLKDSDLPAAQPHLQMFALADGMKKDISDVLSRDFDIVDADSASAAVEKVWQLLNDTQEGKGFRIAVLSHLISGSCGLGYISHEEALDLIGPVNAQARQEYRSWTDYANGFLEGERAWGGSNFMARKFIDKAIAKLRSAQASPWQQLSWDAS